MPIYEPFLSWNEDANYMLSESTFLQQGLEDWASAFCSDSGSKKPLPSYLAQFILYHYTINDLSHLLLPEHQTGCSNIFPIHALPILCPLSSPLLSQYSKFSFFNKTLMVENMRCRQISFPISPVAGSA